MNFCSYRKTQIRAKAHANKKTAESAENISAMMRLLKIKVYEVTFHHVSCHFVSGACEKVVGLSTHRASNVLDQKIRVPCN